MPALYLGYFQLHSIKQFCLMCDYCCLKGTITTLLCQTISNDEKEEEQQNRPIWKFTNDYFFIYLKWTSYSWKLKLNKNKGILENFESFIFIATESNCAVFKSIGWRCGRIGSQSIWATFFCTSVFMHQICVSIHWRVEKIASKSKTKYDCKQMAVVVLHSD